MYKSFFKRFLDFSAALIGFLLISPVFIIVTIGLFLANQGKPFFIQKRPGLHGKFFSILKFKTMNDKKLLLTRYTVDASVQIMEHQIAQVR
jgi:lipopolysaccharide/colanic/teichoic acid biosynthesis glycosyltransferase